MLYPAELRDPELLLSHNTRALGQSEAYRWGMGEAAEARRPAVAGWFYPEARDRLREAVDALCEAAEPPSPSQAAPKGFLVPHAGYAYSGPVAASAYARITPEEGGIRRVVVLGPSHRVPFRGIALPDTAAFDTPLGRIPLDESGIDAIRRLPEVQVLPAAHAQEHAIEVQLPFLQRRLGPFALLPLVVGEADPEVVAEVLEALWGGPETRFLISSDLSHYLPYDQARRQDQRTCAAIADLGPLREPNQACGAIPLNAWMRSARHHGLEPRLLDLRNSGDTGGDRDRVVGYASFAFEDAGGSHGA